MKFGIWLKRWIDNDSHAILNFSGVESVYFMILGNLLVCILSNWLSSKDSALDLSCTCGSSISHEITSRSSCSNRQILVSIFLLFFMVTFLWHCIMYRDTHTHTYIWHFHASIPCFCNLFGSHNLISSNGVVNWWFIFSF